MATRLNAFVAALRRAVRPTETAGTHGVSMLGGYIESREKSPELGSQRARYETYSNILTNVAIVAAGVRYFLNLIGNSKWIVHAEGSTPELATLAEEILMKDPSTPWSRIIRRAAMYRFYGFSVQEWTARRREDGRITFLDVAPRAQSTIERWDVDRVGDVLGIVQRSPQTQEEIYLPRGKVMYLVDDSIHDSPEGLGLFRHLVDPANRLRRYEQLEGYGFEADLRGIPVGRGPFAALSEMVASGELTEEQRGQIERPLRSFIQSHIKNPSLGILLDSQTWQSEDDSARPSTQRQWDVELLKGGATSFAQNAAAIDRLTRELAIILGVEQLLLGSSSYGSFALSRDKTSAFFLQVNSALEAIKNAVREDLLVPIWQLNGLPMDQIPDLKIEAARFSDIESITSGLRDLATAGAVLTPDDPAVSDLRDLMGISRPDPEVASRLEGLALNPAEPSVPGEEQGSPDDT